MTISQVCNFPSGNFQKVRLGPLRRRRLQWGAERCGWDGLRGRAPRLEQAGGRELRLGKTWEVAAWEITHLASCHLGKYPWEIATWEKSFGKVPNIDRYTLVFNSIIFGTFSTDGFCRLDRQ